MFKLLNFFPFLSRIPTFLGGIFSGFQGYLYIAVVCIIAGFSLGYWLESKIASSEVASVRTQFLEYRLSVSQDAVRVTQETVSKERSALQGIQRLNNQLRQSQEHQKQLEEKITESLNNAKDQVPLSDSVLTFLSRLRDSQTK